MFNLSYDYQIRDSASLTPQQLVRLYVETLFCLQEFRDNLNWGLTCQVGPAWISEAQ